MNGAAPVQPPRVVSTLLCHRDVEMALVTLRSLVVASAEPVEFAVHDDGSLTESDVERLVSQLDARVIRRAESDPLMADALAGHPACTAYRDSGVAVALKLFDVAVLGTSEVLAFTDGDILFREPVTGLFDLPGPGVGAVFMQDNREAWSLGPLGYPAAGRLLPSRLNCGLFAIRRSAFDLDRLEWLLSRRRMVALPAFADQTAWGVLARAVGCFYFDPERVAIAVTGVDTGRLAVAHYTSPYRHRFAADAAALARRQAADPPAAPAPIATVPARPATVAGVALAGTRHRLGVRKHEFLAGRRKGYPAPAGAATVIDQELVSASEEKT